MAEAIRPLKYCFQKDRISARDASQRVNEFNPEEVYTEMKWCVFSDAHGNAAFLDAVMTHWQTKGYDGYIFLGDAVGYFPDWQTVIERLTALNCRCLLGNHDAMALGLLPIDAAKDAVYRLNAVRAGLSAEQRAFLGGNQPCLSLTLGSCRCLFVHGTPEDSLTGYGYENTAAAGWNQPDIDFLFMGQTHRPWMRRNDHTTVVNVGSVGLPRDIGNAPSWAVFDDRTGTAEIERLRLNLIDAFPEPPDVHASVWDCLSRKGEAEIR